MSTEQYVPVANIRIRTDARPVDPETVAAIKQSIGQSDDGEPLHPPVVRILGAGFELIDGAHRLRAMAELGNAEIKVSVVTLDDLRAELMMIDGNLCRAELTGILRDQQTARRKAIYEELHPETRLGENQHTRVRQVGEPSVEGAEAPSRQVGKTGKAERFTTATAALTGKSERAVQRSAERGEKISSEAASLIQGTRLDTGAYAGSIKDLPAAEQVAKVRSDLAEPRRPAATPKQTPAPVVQSFARFIELADEIEALRVGDIIASAGRGRAVLGQRANSLADRMNDILEGLDR